MIQVPQNIADSLNELRLIVLIEDEPQSNKYHQVMFNEDQFKKVSDCVSGVFENITNQKEDVREDMEIYDMQVNEDIEIILPSEIRSIN